MTVLEWIRFLIGTLLTLGGLFFLVTAVIGNYRFPYVLHRMHAAGIGDTLGLLLLLAGLAVLCVSPFFVLKLALIVALLWIGSPVASHLIMRMEIRNGSTAESVPCVKSTQKCPNAMIYLTYCFL